MTCVDPDSGFGVNVGVYAGVDETASPSAMVQAEENSKQQPMRSHARYFPGCERFKVNGWLLGVIAFSSDKVDCRIVEW